jgi:ribonuclease III family protein
MESGENASLDVHQDWALSLFMPVELLSLRGDRASLVSKVNQIPVSSLAYLGDAVYELFVRLHCLLPPKRSHDYHNSVVAKVRAEAQADYVAYLEPNLTKIELDVLRRGRNAASGGPKRLVGDVYQRATSFETLVGYLYLTDPARLAGLLQRLPNVCAAQAQIPDLDQAQPPTE